MSELKTTHINEPYAYQYDCPHGVLKHNKFFKHHKFTWSKIKNIITDCVLGKPYTEFTCDCGYHSMTPIYKDDTCIIFIRRFQLNDFEKNWEPDENDILDSEKPPRKVEEESELIVFNTMKY